MVNSDQNIDLDSIFLELGHFGKYQIKTYILMTIPIFASALFTISYAFTCADPPYRCLVPECETEGRTVFKPDWLPNAIGYKEGNPLRCKRYRYIRDANTTFSGEDTCPADWFDREEVDCEGYVFGTQHTSIANDFNLICNGEPWKLKLPGTIHNLGQFISMPLTGFISDRFGRRFAMSAGLLASASFGILRSFSPSYLWFITFEFFDAMLGAAAYASAFILGTELVSPGKRVLIATIMCSAYAIGEAAFGIVTWNVLDWRWVLRYTYGPGLLLAVYFWISPESIRWLISKKKFKEVEDVLKKAAKQNGVTLSQKALDSLEMHNKKPEPGTTQTNNQTEEYPLSKVFKNFGLLCRVINCSICWITCVFVFYGLSLNAVEIAGNMYINFILVSLVEIPGYIGSYLCLDRFGRKPSLCGSFMMSGLSCFAFIFISKEHTSIRLVAFLLGKCSITMAFAVIYVYTAEIFPTPLRQTLLGICSMFGRIGSMIAPQMPLLAVIWTDLPILAFGLMSIISGLLTLLFPETLNIKLPDTIEEAMNINKNKQKLGDVYVSKL